jgi:hypothetical protein
MSITKPICDLGDCLHDPEAIKQRVIRALDEAGQHWQATDFFVRSYDNPHPDGLLQAARQLVEIYDWQKDDHERTTT